jgi:predicted enzyme related to lactoylglutathione lyase
LWAELHTGDQVTAIDFYRSLFGWRTADGGVPGIEYTVLSTAEGEDQRQAGFGGATGLFGEGAGPIWLPYFNTEDADAVAARTRQSGGVVLMEPDDIPTVGRAAVLADPFGAKFAVLKPAPEM